MKVLIVDDENDIRRVTRLSLTHVGRMEVADASSGPEAIRKALLEQPDAILLDVMMPSMDGPSTLAVLRGNPATAAIPVIFVTAKVMASELERLRSLGAAGVLTKPFDPMTLAGEVRAILEGR
jgi:two-component system, OmpR family, response regulator